MAQMDGAVSYCFWEICSKKRKINTGLQGSTLSGPRMTTGFISTYILYYIFLKLISQYMKA